MKRKKNWKYYLKKGATGTISLFLVVLLTPFLTLATVLLEAQHYNSSVALLDEAIGSSSVSVLADYDQYLKKRWGLLATTQQRDMNTAFEDYLKTNTSVLGQTLQVNDTTVNGQYPLTDTAILEQQIKEYSKYNITTQLAADTMEGVLKLLDITNILETLNDGALSDLLELVEGGVDTADSMIEVNDKTETLKNSAGELEKKINACREKFNKDEKAYESRMNQLIEKLGEERPTDEKEADKYDKEIDKKKKNYNEAKDAYERSITELTNQMDTYAKDIDEAIKALETVKTNATKFGQKAVDVSVELGEKNENKIDAENNLKIYETKYPDNKESDIYKNLVVKKEATQSEYQRAKIASDVTKAGKDGLDEMLKSSNDILSYDKQAMSDKITELNSLASSLPSADDITIDSIADGYQIGNIPYVTKGDVDKFIQEQKNSINDVRFKDYIDGMVQICNSLMKFSTFFDPDLSATVNANALLGETDEAVKVIEGVGQAITGAKNFKDADSPKKYWEAIKEVLNGIKTAIENVIKFQTKLVAKLPDNISDFWKTDRFWYVAYCYYMLTCRTDYDKPLPLSALGIQPVLPDAPTQSYPPLINNFAGLADAFDGIANGGTDTTFYGAEMEYLLLGSQSEMINQAYVFMMTYLIRLISDILPIFTNDEVMEIASTIGAVTAGVGEIVVYVLEIFLEPLADTLILVNGGEVQIYETTIFLTISGAVELVDQLVNIINLTDEQKNSFTSSLRKSFGSSSSSSSSGSGGISISDFIPKINYRQQCLIIMMLTVTNKDILKRLVNMIQMETKYYYANENYLPMNFELSKSYTMIETEADVKIKQIAPSLTEKSIFDVKRKLYRGY